MASTGGLISGRRLLQPQAQAVILAAILQMLPRVAASSSSTPAIYPYTPTTILVPSSNSSTVYIFSPNADGQVEFLAVDISSTVSTSSTSNITTLTQGVPFLANNGQENTETTFAPSIRSDGSIFVFEGSCSSNDAATLWTYTPSNDTSATADWASNEISLPSSQTGPWFLGASTAFSNQIAPTMSNSTFYLYGGMCPTNLTATSTSTATSNAATSTATAITASNWQSLASYTNKMVKLVPGTDKYTASTVSSKGPPVAEAGFSFTTLSASTANRSGIVTQEVTSIVLGGHTQKAFVNMSTAAIWSLPEEAWSFVTIANPSSTSATGTELAVVRKSDSSTSAPDSRSGHTAVLSEDGNSLVVLGGWVGDVGQAADPQMAILEMGADYDQWQWSIPDAQPSGSGMYGHGAALLPGNVMLVYGGYNISSETSTSAKLIRRDSSSDSGLMFFNLTSQAWLEDYTNPNSVDESTTTAPTSDSEYTSSSKIGIGVGLGLGIPLAILVLALVVRTCRRNRRRNKRRNDAVQALAHDHQQQHFLSHHDEMIDAGHGSLPFDWIPQHPSGFYTGGHDAYNNIGRKSLGFESLRGTKNSPAFPSYESPKMGAEDSGAFTTLRKPSRNVARGLYQPTTVNDYDAMMSGGAGPGGAAAGNNTKGIHPIYEAEEEEDDEILNEKNEKGIQRKPIHGTTDSANDRSNSPETAEELVDPFLTPTSQTIAAGSSPLRSSYAGAFGPATFNLNPFVRNTPSPDASGPSRPPPVASGASSALTSKAGPASTVGQDRDVQEWVSGLEIEDLLFSPPAPGAGAAIAASVSPGPGQTGPTGTPRGRMSPANVLSSNSNRISLRSKPSNGTSPTRNSFFGAGAAAAVAGAVAGVTGWGGKEDDAARTGSNLSDKSAHTFVSRTGSSQSRLNTGVSAGDNKGSSSDSSSASFNTAPSGFHSLRAEGPSLLYGNVPPPGQVGVAGTASAPNSISGSIAGSVRTRTSSPVHYNLRAPPALHSQGLGLSSFEYGGAATVYNEQQQYQQHRQGLIHGHQRSHTIDEGDENTALTGSMPGSPSKSKPRRTWMGNLMRIFSSSSPAHGAHEGVSDHEALDSSMGTGAQQGGANYQNMAHATLLRRKQGRSDWEADEWREEESTAVGAIRSGGRTASLSSVHGFGHGHSHPHALSHGHSRSLSHGAGGPSGMGTPGNPSASGLPAGGSVAAGRREGSGKSDDWDVEKAVQNRVVQVMFTMPRDQLRVVNAEVERDEDEADLGTQIAATVPAQTANTNNTDIVNVNDTSETLSIKKRRRATKEIDTGDLADLNLSGPTPPPILHKPYQSYRSMSPIHVNAAALARAGLDNDQYRAMPPPPELVSPRLDSPGSPISPGSPGSPDHLSHIVKRQDDHMREMHEALAESKRLLSGQHLPPWTDDRDPRPRSFISNADDELNFHNAQSTPNKANMPGSRDISWMDSSSVPAPLTPKGTPRSSRQNTPTGVEIAQRRAVDDEYTLATAAALARTLLQARRPVPSPGTGAGPSSNLATSSTPPRAPAPASRLGLGLSESALSPSARAIPTRPASPVKTPSKAASNEALGASASRRSAKSLKSTKSTKTLKSTKSVQSMKSTTSSKSGFVADMVDRIETSSPSKMQ